MAMEIKRERYKHLEQKVREQNGQNRMLKMSTLCKYLISNHYHQKQNNIQMSLNDNTQIAITYCLLIGASTKRSSKSTIQLIKYFCTVRSKRSDQLNYSKDVSQCITANQRQELLIRIVLSLFMYQQKQDWSAEDNLNAAIELKSQGNLHFQKKQYQPALKAYHKAILHLAGIIDKKSSVSMYAKNVANSNIANQSNELKFSIYMNMAQIYIYQNKYEKGLDMQLVGTFRLSKGSQIKTNAKLFYRRGICNMKLSNFEQAKQDFTQVINLDPSLKAQIDKLTKQLKDLEKISDEKSKNMFQKFFK